MKTAISLPDDLFKSADTLAARLGMTRSGLVAAALREYLAKHKSEKVSERLNAVYEAEDGRLEKTVRRAQRRSVVRSDEW